MQPLQFVGLDQVQITPEQYQLIQEAVITAARPPLVGRQVMPVRELNDFGITQLKTWTQTDMSAAAIGMAALQGNADVVGLAPGTLNIPVIWKDFQIYARDLASTQRLGIPLDTTFATDAGRRVAELEETLIWEGAGGYTGFQGVSGLSHATTGSWKTSPNAYNDFAMAVAALEAAGYAGRYAMIVSPVQKAYLRLMFTGTGVSLLEKIQEEADVYTSFFFADDANALVVAPDPANFELQIGQNTVTHPAVLPTGDLFFRVYEAVIPQFKRATSIFNITTIVFT
jgi:uncharacterized linocin/CFP29 family protein